MKRSLHRNLTRLATTLLLTHSSQALAETRPMSVPELQASAEAARVPVWTDAQILTQFKLIRDERYLYEGGVTSGPKRRIPWLDPSGGCDQRAALAYHLMMSDANATKYPYVRANPPWKIRAVYDDGDLNAWTPYALNPDVPWQNGGVAWSSHIAPVVKNTQGQFVVLDPAFNHCVPLKLNDWLAALVTDAESGSTLFYYPNNYAVTLVEPTPASAAAANLAENKTRVESFLLGYERTRLSELPWTHANKVSQMLGDYPPWAGNACISITQKYSAYVPVGSSLHNTIHCPSGTLAVGGGFSSGTESLAVLGTGKLDNGTEGWWADSDFNETGVPQQLSMSIACLSGAPSNASVTKVSGATQRVASQAAVTATATCPSGLLVGGGFETSNATYSNTPEARVFRSRKSATLNHTWEVTAYNPSSDAKLLTAYAVCLNNTSFSVEQAIGTLGTDGTAKATCQGMLHAMGGGFEFPVNKPYQVSFMNNLGTGQFVVQMTQAPASSDLEAKAFAMCLRSEPDPSSMCTASTAVDLGAASTKLTTVAGNACLKISAVLPSWTKSIALQSQGSGSNYPIGFTWSNCSTELTSSFSGNWETRNLSPVSSACTTLLRLTGSASSRVSLKWWPNG